MVEYNTCAIFINSATEIQARITNIRLVQSALRAQRLAAALDPSMANIQEYQLDDGQTKIKTIYRSLSEINTAMHVLERELQDCYNQANGRITRSVDSKNLNTRFGYTGNYGG